MGSRHVDFSELIVMQPRCIALDPEVVGQSWHAVRQSPNRSDPALQHLAQHCRREAIVDIRAHGALPTVGVAAAGVAHPSAAGVRPHGLLASRIFRSSASDSFVLAAAM